jgi:hypothetical protein
MKILAAAARFALLVALPTGFLIAGILLNMEDADQRAAGGGKPDAVTTSSITR